MPRKCPPEDRFWTKVHKTETCWLWIAGLSSTGYGTFNLGRIDGHLTVTNAHKWAYEHLVGPVPGGLHLDHLCRVPRCVNPAHLEAVAPRINWRRGESPTAIVNRTNRCKRGHEYTPENTYERPDGKPGRNCRICIRIRSDRLQARRVAARTAA